MKELVDMLTKNLGIDGKQAEGGAAVLFKAAKDKLGAAEFGSLLGGVPGLSDLMHKAPPAGGGLGGMLGGLAGAMIVREQLPNVFLSIVEAMSHVLIDTLARADADFILCYDVPDLPQFSRTALLQDDLVLVTPPRDGNGKPIAPVDALEESIAMPEEGDSVRTAISGGLSGLPQSR